ncbi:methylated-DNA--[protein]-cysteine S-methyltransferase [Clostridium oceanicum]|uniref:Methylated-DNA-[protein]-cysteine S-methyltransferase DNA binding domain-containing protein n=1 Tax=Clostridium oceanicum TaxID=1543 RepID=A0ABN1JSN3_9CLOT
MIENYPQCEQTKIQICEYFNGKRKKFDIKVNIEGTDFQKKVWQSVSDIPYGKIKSYKDIANMIDNPYSMRAVGQANRRNPIPIIVPCHRVIGKSGKLTGYCGDKTYIKEFLIDLENKNNKG